MHLVVKIVGMRLGSYNDFKELESIFPWRAVNQMQTICKLEGDSLLCYAIWNFPLNNV
jgi:hypothetical protein